MHYPREKVQTSKHILGIWPGQDSIFSLKCPEVLYASHKSVHHSPFHSSTNNSGSACAFQSSHSLEAGGITGDYEEELSNDMWLNNIIPKMMPRGGRSRDSVVYWPWLPFIGLSTLAHCLPRTYSTTKNSDCKEWPYSLFYTTVS